MREESKSNLQKDAKVQGAEWGKTYSGWFTNEMVIQDFIRAAKPYIPPNPSVMYAGSAAGLLGEELIKQTGGQLTIVDMSQAHLDQNTNSLTKKICADVLDMRLNELYDVIIMRSSLDYFHTNELQIEALTNIVRHLKPGGVLINQPTYFDDPHERDVMTRAYNCTGKIGLRFFQSTDMADIYRAAGLSAPTRIGESAPMTVTSEDHVSRYGIDLGEITEIQQILRGSKTHAKVTDSGYVMQFDFPIFLAKRL